MKYIEDGRKVKLNKQKNLEIPKGVCVFQLTAKNQENLEYLVIRVNRDN